MKNDIYKKLVDLYAGAELPAELEDDLRAASLNDSELETDMRSMRETMDAIHAVARPEFTEESYQRILMKVYARGGEITTKSPTPNHLQYYLPIQG